MPFTTSHPAIILPFKRLWPNYFSLTGLVAGAMAPDFIFFLQLTTANRGLSHSWTGLFIFCLPAGILFSLVFHHFFKEEFVNRLPLFLNKRLVWLLGVGGIPASIRQWIIFVASVLVGVLSHFFWDSWTHGSGETVRAFPWLLTALKIGKFKFPLYEIIHHTSSVIGGLFVAAMLLRKPVNRPLNDTLQTTTTTNIILFQTGGFIAAVLLAVFGIWLHGVYLEPEMSLLHSRRFLSVTAGLSTWAGYFYYVCTVGFIRRVRGRSFNRL